MSENSSSGSDSSSGGGSYGGGPYGGGPYDGGSSGGGSSSYDDGGSGRGDHVTGGQPYDRPYDKQYDTQGQSYGAQPYQPGYQQPYPQGHQQPYGQDFGRFEGEKAAQLSLILGLVGLFFAGMILGPLAIWQASKAEKLGVPATAGKVLGWISTILWILGLVSGIAFFVIVLASLGAAGTYSG